MSASTLKPTFTGSISNPKPPQSPINSSSSSSSPSPPRLLILSLLQFDGDCPCCPVYPLWRSTGLPYSPQLPNLKPLTNSNTRSLSKRSELLTSDAGFLRKWLSICSINIHFNIIYSSLCVVLPPTHSSLSTSRSMRSKKSTCALPLPFSTPVRAAYYLKDLDMFAVFHGP